MAAVRELCQGADEAGRPDALQGWNAEGGYSPYSSMSALPWQPGAMFAAPDGGAFPDESSSWADASASGADDDVEPSLAEVGVPVLEVFLRRDGQGRLLRQAAVLTQEADGGVQGAAGGLMGAFAGPRTAPSELAARRSHVVCNQFLHLLLLVHSTACLLTCLHVMCAAVCHCLRGQMMCTL